MALLLGSIFAVLLFANPVETFLEDLTVLRNFSLAVSVGFLILAMAITDTEHPPGWNGAGDCDATMGPLSSSV